MDMEFKEEADSDEEALSPLSHLSLNVRLLSFLPSPLYFTSNWINLPDRKG